MKDSDIWLGKRGRQRDSVRNIAATLAVKQGENLQKVENTYLTSLLDNNS